MVNIRYMSVKGPFKTIKEEKCADVSVAFDTVVKYYAPMGFADFQKVIDEDDCGIRITAKTPGGRSGRNLAYIDYADESY